MSTLYFTRLRARFIHDEHGSAMTEFTIFLPFFVMTFVAILQLWAIEDLAVRGKANGYAKAMGHHTQIQTGLTPNWQMSPISGSINAMNYHVNTSSGTDLAADALLEIPVAQGHLAESFTRVILAGFPTDTANTMMEGTPVVYKPPPAHLYSHVGGPGLAFGRPMTPDRMIVEQWETEPWSNPQVTFTNALFSDHFNPGALAGSGSKAWYDGVINNALSAGGLRPAVAAGMRYGVTSDGYFDETTSLLGLDYTVQSATHVAAPTRPTMRWISTAVVRAYLTQDEAYDDYILKFAMTPATSAGTPDTSDFDECQAELQGLSSGGISSGTIEGFRTLCEGMESGNICSNGASYDSSGGRNPFEAFTRIFDNAKAILGTSAIPTQESTGRYGDNGRPLGL